MQKRNKSNSKKRNTSLTLGEDELLAVTVQKYPCLYGKSDRSHKEKKNAVENTWEVVIDELDLVEDGKNVFCYFPCVLNDYNIFCPILPNINFQYCGMTKLSHRS